MLEKLSPKDLRALKLGAIVIVALIVLLFVWDMNEQWTEAQESFDLMNSKLDALETVDMTKAQYAGLMSIIPVFEMPMEKEEQKFLFQDSLNEQFKKANVKSQPWEEIERKDRLLNKYEVLNLQTSGKCNITQLFDLLVNLKENPYLISVEELTMKRDAKNKQQVDFDLIVSTPVKPVKSSKGLL